MAIRYTCLLLLFLLLLIIPGDAVDAQEYSYTRYNTKDGLAGSTVYGMAQDKDGFIWFGTETGLSRFDGTHFKNFTIADGLPSNEVFGLYVDTKNRIWITCFKNAACYYSKGKIHNQQNDTTLKKITLNSQLDCIAENAAGDILIGCLHVEHFIISNAFTVQQIIKGDSFIHKQEKIFNPISGIGFLPTCLATAPDYIRQQSGERFLIVPQPNSIAFANRISHYAYQSNHTEYIAIDTMVFFREKSQQGSFIQLPKITRIRPVNYNTYAFLRSYNGVTLYNVDSTPLTSDYLTRYVIHYVIEDAEKNLWFSTKGFGVLKLSNARFKNYSFENLGVRYIQQINNRVYIGTDNSNYWSMPSLNAVSFNQDTSRKPIKIQGNLDFIAARKTNAYVNIANSDFLHFNKIKYDYRYIKTLQLYHDTVLVASTVMSYRMLRSTRRILDTLYIGRTTCAYQQNSIYYIGTIDGLYRIIPGKPKQFLGDTDSMFKCHITQVAEGIDGSLWIATYNRGIIGYKDGRIIARIGEHTGLTSNICRCLFVAGNNLWAGTDKGLNKIDISPGKYTVMQKFTETDGLNSNVVNAVYCAGTYVYVGTSLGMTVFDEARIPKHAISNILMTGIIISGTEQNPLKNDLVLEHQDNNIRFEYSGISFLSEGNITYQYRLLGLSDQWQFSKETMLNYPSLPSGEYRLQLLAINKFGDRSRMLEYRFKIRKLVWEEFWFQALAILLIIALTGIIVRYRIQQAHLKERERILTTQKIMELEQVALRAQMNPHFIFNSLNSFYQYVINKDIIGASKFMSDFSTLIRLLFEINSLKEILLDKEILFLKTYLELEKTKLNNAFSFVFNIQEGILQEEISIPTFIIQPFIENSIRHGIANVKDKAGKIDISITIDTTFMIVKVEDNGVGRKYTEKQKNRQLPIQRSRGISLTNERIALYNRAHHADINFNVIDKYEHERPTGTVIVIYFPLKDIT